MAFAFGGRTASTSSRLWRHAIFVEREAMYAEQLQETRQLVGRVRSPAFRRIPRQQNLGLLDYPGRGVPVREPPALLASRKQH